MISFKKWLFTKESSASTRRALGIYPPQPGDFFVRPPYGLANTCKKLDGFKLSNMNVANLCKGQGKKKKG